MKELKKADQSFTNGDYADALRGFLPLLESLDSAAIDQYSLNFKVGFAYYVSAPEDSFAVPFFRKYLESSQDHFEAYYFLGNIAASSHMFDSAIFSFNKFISAVEENTELSNSGLSEQIIDIAKRQVEKCEFGNFLLRNPGCAEIESATGGVNTIYSEYGPVISPDETTLAFTRRSPETLGGRISDDGDFFEDIYFARINKTTVPLETDSFGNPIGDATTEITLFTAPVNIGQRINTVGHEGAIQFSADEAKFFIYRKSNIWVSKKKKKQTSFATKNWKKAKRQNQIKGVFKPKTFEPSVSISPDENTIYFSSERPGGFGGLDLYKSEKGPDGKWTAPVNLGDTINTHQDEDAPFIAADGKTLYFSSKGHENMGDYDIFVAEFNGERWTKPLNLGFPVNSASNDIFYSVSPLSGTGYFSSDRFDGLGLMDIYKASFPANTTSIARINGISIDNNAPVSVAISLIPADNAGDSLVLLSNETGNFSSQLKFGKTYFLQVNDINFEPYYDTVTVPDLKFYCQHFSDSVSINLQKIIRKDTMPARDSALAAWDTTTGISNDSLVPDTAAPANTDLPVAENKDSSSLSDSLAKSQIKDALVKILKAEKKPVQEKLPDQSGVIFRVQIGAYKKQLSKNIYENIPDLQAIPFEDGFTRYFTGSFKTIGEARARREEIVKEGFADAFIVTFRDGKKMR